jgi:hypothetical protein
MENTNQNETGHFSDKELNEILASFEQMESSLTEEQMDKIQAAWDQVKRNSLYKNNQ